MSNLPVAQDVDDLHGDAVIAELRVRENNNGSLEVSGDIYHLKYALDMLRFAKEAVLEHHRRFPQLVAINPSRVYAEKGVYAEIQIKARRNGNMSTAGAINDQRYALALLDHARETVKQYHRKLEVGDTVKIPQRDTALYEA